MQRKYGQLTQGYPPFNKQLPVKNHTAVKVSSDCSNLPPQENMKKSFIIQNCQYPKTVNFNQPLFHMPYTSPTANIKNTNNLKPHIFNPQNSPNNIPQSIKNIAFQNHQPNSSFQFNKQKNKQTLHSAPRVEVLKKSEIIQPNHYTSINKIPEFNQKIVKEESPLLLNKPNINNEANRTSIASKNHLKDLLNQSNKKKMMQSVIMDNSFPNVQHAQKQSLNKSGKEKTSTLSSETNKEGNPLNQNCKSGSKIKRPTIWPVNVQTLDKKSHEEEQITFRKKQMQIQQNEKDISEFQMRNRLSAPLPTRQRKQFKIEDFEIVEKIGKGAYGDVFLAQQKKTCFLCVIKTISKQKIKQQKLQQHIFRQIKLQFYMNHRHLTPLFGCFHDENKVYLVLEYMTDGNLTHVYRKKKVPQPTTSSLARQVCQGLYYMHRQNILHRDLKPQNLFIHEDYIKIGDFGCAVFSNTLRSTVVGCLAYISPEQLSNCQYDEKIDVWSLGILTYELLTGKPPFQEDIIKIAKHEQEPKLSQLIFPTNVELSEEAIDFIRKLLRQDPNQRMDLRSALKHPFITKYREMQMNKMG